MITAVEPGRSISWARTEPMAGTVEWSYRFEPHEDGTEVTKRYAVTAPIRRVGWLIITTMSPGDRRAQMRAGMEETLRRIKATAEGAPSGP